jgi:hypothetical protein
MNNVNFTNQQSDLKMAQVCPHCLGTEEHEAWCVTCDPKVHYAYEIVDEPRKLTLGDALILHSLGVTWSELAVQY